MITSTTTTTTTTKERIVELKTTVKGTDYTFKKILLDTEDMQVRLEGVNDVSGVFEAEAFFYRAFDGSWVCHDRDEISAVARYFARKAGLNVPN